jgi:hypothetical protein
MPEQTAKRPSPRERLLEAFDELFYRDGAHSTGIDAVIDKAGVAKVRCTTSSAAKTNWSPPTCAGGSRNGGTELIRAMMPIVNPLSDKENCT